LRPVFFRVVFLGAASVRVVFVTVVSAGNDPDHFAADYFPSGFRWQLPDLPASEKAYQLARQAFEAAGRKILDATVGGNLRVFPRVDYHQLF